MQLYDAAITHNTAGDIHVRLSPKAAHEIALLDQREKLDRAVRRAVSYLLTGDPDALTDDE